MSWRMTTVWYLMMGASRLKLRCSISTALLRGQHKAPHKTDVRRSDLVRSHALNQTGEASPMSGWSFQTKYRTLGSDPRQAGGHIGGIQWDSRASQATIRNHSTR